jgi:hypothetical protein
MMAPSSTTPPENSSLAANFVANASTFAANAASRSSLAVPGRLQPVRTDAATIAATRRMLMELLISGPEMLAHQHYLQLRQPAA